jgi:Spy/CpxP family protein refolding chaperone
MFRRTILTSCLAVALAGTAVLAQGFHSKAAGRFGGQSGQNFIERMQQRLNLTPAQVDGIRALQENRQKQMQALRQEMQPERKALRQLLQQPNPNPTDVGNATLAMRGTREKAREINQKFVAGVKGLLTPDQIQKLPKRLQL